MYHQCPESAKRRSPAMVPAPRTDRRGPLAHRDVIDEILDAVLADLEEDLTKRLTREMRKGIRTELETVVREEARRLIKKKLR
jgi:hypothetical protein